APLCRIWLLPDTGEGLVLGHPTEETGPERIEPDGAPPWKAFRDQAAVLIAGLAEGGESEAAAAFCAGLEAGSVLCLPLFVDEGAVGSMEVVRPAGAAPFTGDDADFLEGLARQAAISLRNANLFQAEKKAKELDVLLEISREISATLDLDHVLATLVNRAG